MIAEIRRQTEAMARALEDKVAVVTGGSRGIGRCAAELFAREGAALAVDTEFMHATARSAFRLGTFAPGDATHQNTRFPGFFFHAAYLPEEVKKGQLVSWGWPWQGGQGGRMKRWDARIAGWEQVNVPAGMYRALRLEADLLYLEAGKVKAKARETIWYAPEVAQVVKVVRDGATPDEGLQHITAELAEYR